MNWSGLYPRILNVRKNDVSFRAAATMSGYGYFVITSPLASWPTKDNIVAGRDSTNTPVALGYSGKFVLGSGVVATASGYLLPANTTLRMSVVGSGVNNVSTSGYRFTFATDPAAAYWLTGYPKLGANTTGTTISASGKINQSGTLSMVIVPAASGVPTSTQIAAGKNAGGQTLPQGKKYSKVVSGSGSIGVVLGTGLISETAYKMYLVASGVESGLRSSGYALAFTTPDVTAPSWATGYPRVGTILRNTAVANMKINDSGTYWFVTLPSDASDPSEAQVKAFTDANGVAVKQGKKGTGALTANTAKTVNITGLHIGTHYQTFFVAEDEVGNNTSTAVSGYLFRTKLIAAAPAHGRFSLNIQSVTERRRRLLRGL